MTPTTTQHRNQATPLRPVRLPTPPPAPASKGRALLALLGSAILLIGVPVALVLLVGNPLPTTAPSRAWLTADINASVVIDVVAVGRMRPVRFPHVRFDGIRCRMLGAVHVHSFGW